MMAVETSPAGVTQTIQGPPPFAPPLAFALACCNAAANVANFWTDQTARCADAWLALMEDGPFIGGAEAAAKLLLSGPELWSEACAQHLRAVGLKAPLLSDA